MRLKKQQWEMLVSPGHVLLAQVNAYRVKIHLPTLLAGIGIVLWLASFWIAPTVGKHVGGAVGWVVGKGAGLVAGKPVPVSMAPQLRELAPVVPAGFQFDEQKVPSLASDVVPAMKDQVAAMVAGKRMEDCNFGRKITESWFDGVDMTPRCRYSKEFDRLWVWALVNNKGQYQAWMGLITKVDGDVKLVNLGIRGVAQIDGAPGIAPSQIPRAIAADFPELTK